MKPVQSSFWALSSLFDVLMFVVVSVGTSVFGYGCFPAGQGGEKFEKTVRIKVICRANLIGGHLDCSVGQDLDCQNVFLHFSVLSFRVGHAPYHKA